MIESVLNVLAQVSEIKMTDVKEGLHENVPGGLLLVIAYGVIVVAVVAYVVRLVWAARRIEERIEAMENRVGKGEGSGAGEKRT